MVYTLLLVGLVVMGSVTAFSVFGGPLSLLSLLPGPDATTGRLELIEQTLQLCCDYPFTGGGLMGFAGLYSTYIRVIPFFQFSYSHNLFLDVLLEQGVGGLLSLLIILLASFPLLRPPKSSVRDRRISKEIRLFRWAVFAGLVALVLHGIMDDALYGTQGTPLLFLLPGLAIAFSSKYERERSYTRGTTRRIIFAAAVVVLGIMLAATFAQTLQGKWYSNLGAVRMAKVELAQWPTNRWNNGSNVEDLAASACLFERALSKVPDNATARFRLGLIEMLRRDYSEAAAHLEVAYVKDDRHRGVIKSLGYCYVWRGQFDDAAVLLSRIPEAGEEMAAYSHWWRVQGREDLASNAARMAARLASESSASN
jgi:O-antigen ligase